MDNNNLSPEESFAIISKSIANFKMNYKENGKFFLLWGWMMSMACFSLHLILMILHKQEAYELMGFFSLGNWAVFILSAFIIQYFMIRKMDKDKKVHSHLDSYIKKLWGVAGASMFVATFISFRLGLDPPTIILLIAGIATTVSGLFIKFKPLLFGGIAFFIFSIVTTYISNEYLSLITGLAIICGYLIPGYFLKFAKE